MTDITGESYGLWTVVAMPEKGSNKILCQCRCGTNRKVFTYNLRHGKSLSCGCRVNDMKRIRQKVHGHTTNSSSSPTYKAWDGMIARCRNQKTPGYKNYGGRGISVCDRWLKFENFLEDMGEKPVGLTLDRKDTNGNYEPMNCRWADRVEQNNNRRCNRMVALSGMTLTASEWGRRLCLSVSTIYNRIKAGRSPKEILRPFSNRLEVEE